MKKASEGKKVAENKDSEERESEIDKTPDKKTEIEELKTEGIVAATVGGDNEDSDDELDPQAPN